jgi:hypothetical protein
LFDVRWWRTKIFCSVALRTTGLVPIIFVHTVRPRLCKVRNYKEMFLSGDKSSILCLKVSPPAALASISRLRSQGVRDYLLTFNRTLYLLYILSTVYTSPPFVCAFRRVSVHSHYFTMMLICTFALLLPHNYVDKSAHETATKVVFNYMMHSHTPLLTIGRPVILPVLDCVRVATGDKALQLASDVCIFL